MILRRVGNKSRIAEDVYKHFPYHTMYVEMFFGSGGLFFNKPKVKYNIVNDNDSEVFNFYTVIVNDRERFLEELSIVPYHEDLWNLWRKTKFTDPVMQAVRFLVLSNYGFMGKSETLKFGMLNQKELAIERIDQTFKLIHDVQFMNVDFRKVLSKIGFRKSIDKASVFIYADPPYLETCNNYEGGGFTEEDTFDLFELLQESDMKFSISEFDHPFIIDQANKRGLNIINIGERQNMKNRKMEVLITNFEERQQSLFKAS